MKEVLQSIFIALMIGFFAYSAVILFNRSSTGFQCNKTTTHYDREAEIVTDKVEEGIQKAKRVQDLITGSSSKSRTSTTTTTTETKTDAAAAVQATTTSTKSSDTKPTPTAKSTSRSTYNYTPPSGSIPAFTKDGHRYQVQLATISKGKIEIDRFKSIEEFGSISVDKKRGKSRVILGDFYSKEEAAYYLSLIKQRGHRDAFVIKDQGKKAIAINRKPAKAKAKPKSKSNPKPQKKQQTKKKRTTTNKAKSTTTTTLVKAGPPSLNIEVIRPLTSSTGQFAVRLGKYKNPSKEELVKLNDLGVVYMIEETPGTHTAYLGNYTDHKSLDVVLAQVKKRGYKGAFETNAITFGTTGMIFVDETTNQALENKKQTQTVSEPVTKKASPSATTSNTNVTALNLERNDFIIQLVSALEPDLKASRSLTSGGNIYTQYDPRSKRTVLYLGGFKDPKKANEVLERVITQGFDSAFIKTVSANDLNTIVLMYEKS